MSKIKVVSTFVEAGYLFVIDDKGVIHKKHIPGGSWTVEGELPDEK